jgi:hypothetical protein
MLHKFWADFVLTRDCFGPLKSPKKNKWVFPKSVLRVGEKETKSEPCHSVCFKASDPLICFLAKNWFCYLESDCAERDTSDLGSGEWSDGPLYHWDETGGSETTNGFRFREFDDLWALGKNEMHWPESLHNAINLADFSRSVSRRKIDAD